MKKSELTKIIHWLSRDSLRYFRLTHEPGDIYNLSWGVDADPVEIDVQEEKSNDLRVEHRVFGGVQHYRVRAYTVPDLLERAMSRENRVEYGGLSPDDFDVEGEEANEHSA